MSGATRSRRRFKRLLRLITRRYKSFKSDVAKRPPSNGTNGRKSGGKIGSTFMIIHSGLLPEAANASINFKRFVTFLRFVSLPISGSSSRICATSPSKSICCSKASTASAPISASNSSPCSSRASRYSSSVRIALFSNVVIPGSVTTYDSKYSTRSISRRVISSNKPIRDGNDFKNQICATGLANSMWPIRSRRTFVNVTSTPHFSQITPRCFKRLYLPQRHS